MAETLCHWCGDPIRRGLFFWRHVMVIVFDTGYHRPTPVRNPPISSTGAADE